jgi:CelD/BcsL family acetyltransferase involved in cellulose biosynthesis
LAQEQVLTQAQTLSRAGHTDLKVEIVRDLERFNALAPEWERLVNRWAADPLFLSHTWFQAWWDSFGAGRELHIVTLRSSGELVAAAPMMRTRAGLYGLKVDTLQGIYNPHTPRYDFIVGNNQEFRFYEAIWNELVRGRPSDMIMLPQIPDGSRTIRSMQTLAERAGWLSGQWVAPVSPFITLGCNYEAFFNTLKGGCRYNLRKRYERLNKLGPVDVEVITEHSAVREAMKDGLRIEAAAWKGREGTAILSDPAVVEFYIRLAERQAELGRLRLTFLRMGGKRISFNYVLHDRKKLYGVKIGYDPEYHTYSPGNMLLNLILQTACDEGIEEYDFLGVDDEWKFEWTKQSREHRWLFLFRNGLRPRLLHYLKFGLIPKVKPGLKSLCTYLPGRA